MIVNQKRIRNKTLLCQAFHRKILRPPANPSVLIAPVIFDQDRMNEQLKKPTFKKRTEVDLQKVQSNLPTDVQNLKKVHFAILMLCSSKCKNFTLN